MAMAANGKPNICLTLTARVTSDEGPIQRYERLHTAWRALVKRILRQFSLPPEKRWVLKTEEGYEYQDVNTYAATAKTSEKSVKKLHYMAFNEETEAGEPHLHILLRTRYIPQKWISQIMDILMSSPVVWIERIRGAGKCIAYVAKYVTKSPAQFGKHKRYWVSRNYEIVKKEYKDTVIMDKRNSRIKMQRFEEFIRETVLSGKIPIPLTTNIVRLLSLRETSRQYPGFSEGEPIPDLIKSYLWLAVWRKKCRV